MICPCNVCSEHLEFDRSAAGSTVACPHCGVDTVLFIPPPLASAVPPPVVQDDKAKLFSIQNRVNNANALQIFGWVGCVGSLLGCLAVLTDSENSEPFSPFTVALAAVSFSVAAGILALYGLARGKKLRRELAPIAKKVQEEVALRNAELAREKAARDAALQSKPEMAPEPKPPIPPPLASAVPPPNAADIKAPDTKKCPFCAEIIRFEAIKCKHCGSMLNKPPPAIQQTGAQPRKVTPGEWLTGEKPGQFSARERLSGLQPGKYSCPSCHSTATNCQRAIGLPIIILMFVSCGLGLILLFFLPYNCTCLDCGFKWKS